MSVCFSGTLMLQLDGFPTGDGVQVNIQNHSILRSKLTGPPRSSVLTDRTTRNSDLNWQTRLKLFQSDRNWQNPPRTKTSTDRSTQLQPKLTVPHRTSVHLSEPHRAMIRLWITLKTTVQTARTRLDQGLMLLYHTQNLTEPWLYCQNYTETRSLFWVVVQLKFLLVMERGPL